MSDVHVPLPAPVRRVADVPPRQAAVGIGVASVGVVALLLWLVTSVDVGEESSSAWMPLVNATLNAAAATFLVLGWRHVRAGRIDEHRRAMLTALGCSAAFLVGYLTHHVLHGDTPFGSDGAIRTVYLALLAVHVILSTLGLPFVLATAWSATVGRTELHRRVARRTLPVWLTVSVTGVAVALLLRFVG